MPLLELGQEVLPPSHTQPGLLCLSLHTRQVAARTHKECQGEECASAFETGHSSPAAIGATWSQLPGSGKKGVKAKDFALQWEAPGSQSTELRVALGERGPQEPSTRTGLHSRSILPWGKRKWCWKQHSFPMTMKQQVSHSVFLFEA